MSSITYKCSNCGGGLQFNPETQKLLCEFCQSEFTDEEIALIYAEREKAARDRQSERQSEAERTAHPDGEKDFNEHTVVYKCDNCGAEILTDDTTAATTCCYCHSPVVLSGRLRGEMCPSKIVPFAFDRETAKGEFLRWARKKWFVPKDFFCEKQIEHIAGVYYPFWLTDSDVHARLTAVACNIRTWTSGDHNYTETSTYHVVREAAIHFEDIVTGALKKADANLLKGILPFPVEAVKDFSMRLLAGFIAEKRDINKEDTEKEVEGRIEAYAEKMLRDTVAGYTSFAVRDLFCAVKNIHRDYTFMPVWILTYIDQKSGKIYTYALNGQTKAAYGELPVSFAKLAALLAGVSAAVFALLTITGGFLL